MATEPQHEHAAEGAIEAGRGAVFIGFAKVFFMISGFLQRWLLTRIMGAAEYGGFALVNGVVSTVNNTVVQGTIQAVSKFTSEDEGRAGAVKRAGLRLQAISGAVLAGGFFLAAPLLAAGFKAAGHVGWFRLVAVIPFLYGLYAVFVGSANGLRRFRVQAGFDVAFSCMKTVLMLGAAWLAKPSGAAVTGAFSGFALAAALILIAAAFVMRLPAADTTAFPVRRLFLFMAGVVVYMLLVNLVLNYDLWILRRFAGAAASETAADTLAGQYEALRNLALLPYQALLVVTFVIFPLVSRSTFVQDQAATTAYVSGTLRVAWLFASGLGVTLAARPTVVLGMLYKPEYLAGAAALPVLVAGICCLAILSISCAIINASGRPAVAAGLVLLTVLAGSALAVLFVRTQPVGPAMMTAMAWATSLGMALGMGAGLVYVRLLLRAGPPLATVLRAGLGVGAAAGAARLVPRSGFIAGAGTLLLTIVVFGLVLRLTRELTPSDRAKIARILQRKRF